MPKLSKYSYFSLFLFFLLSSCHFDFGRGRHVDCTSFVKEQKNSFCIPNLCGLNIAKDAILTGPEAEFLSVGNREHPREWWWSVVSFPWDAHQPWMGPSWMRCLRVPSSVGLLAGVRQHRHPCVRAGLEH